jgi:uncharacterized protein
LRFWDSSAVTALLVQERESPAMRTLLRAQPRMYVWWGTEIECVSAIARLERDGLDSRTVAAAISRLARFVEDWHEVGPGPSVRDTAKRLLRSHALRSADALQLAAAWVVSDFSPSSVEIVTLDNRLRDAAVREGFVVLPEI